MLAHGTSGSPRCPVAPIRAQLPGLGHGLGAGGGGGARGGACAARAARPGRGVAAAWGPVPAHRVRYGRGNLGVGYAGSSVPRPPPPRPVLQAGHAKARHMAAALASCVKQLPCKRTCWFLTHAKVMCWYLWEPGVAHFARCRYAAGDGRVGNASLSGCMAVIQEVLAPVRCTAASWEEGTLAAAGSAERGSDRQSSTGGGLVGSEGALGAATRGADAGSGGNSRSLLALQGAMEGDAHTANSAHVHNPDEGAHFAGGSSNNGGGNSANTGRKSRRRRAEAVGTAGDAGKVRAGQSGVGVHGGPRCTLLGAHLPALHGRFVAVENFAWTASALGLPEGATLRQLRDVGEDFCARHWSVLHAQYSDHIPDQVGGGPYGFLRRVGPRVGDLSQPHVLIPYRVPGAPLPRSTCPATASVRRTFWCCCMSGWASGWTSGVWRGPTRLRSPPAGRRWGHHPGTILCNCRGVRHRTGS